MTFRLNNDRTRVCFKEVSDFNKNKNDDKGIKIYKNFGWLRALFGLSFKVENIGWVSKTSAIHYLNDHSSVLNISKIKSTHFARVSSVVSIFNEAKIHAIGLKVLSGSSDVSTSKAVSLDSFTKTQPIVSEKDESNKPIEAVPDLPTLPEIKPADDKDKLHASDQNLVVQIKGELETIPSLEVLFQRIGEIEQRGSDAELNELINPTHTEVIPGLILGNQREIGVNIKKNRERILDNLKTLEIKKIITCCLIKDEKIKDEEQFDGFTYEYCGIGDAPLNEDAAKSEKFIENISKAIKSIHASRLKGEVVFIHCNAGASRSASFVVAYLMVLGLTFEESYRYLKNKRLLVNINNFENKLKEADTLNQLKALL